MEKQSKNCFCKVRDKNVKHTYVPDASSNGHATYTRICNPSMFVSACSEQLLSQKCQPNSVIWKTKVNASMKTFAFDIKKGTFRGLNIEALRNVKSKKKQ